MVLKAVFLLFLLTVSQAFAASVLQLRSLEALESRQSECPMCTTLKDTISACTTLPCLCNPTRASDLQSCVTCLVTKAPTRSVICAARDLITIYASSCEGTSGIPAVTLPPGTQVPTDCPQTSPATKETGPLGAVLGAL